jgi:hypothetical protein
MFTIRKAVCGKRSVKRAAPRARPTVEALGERVMLTTIPNLTGDTIVLDGLASGRRTLKFDAVQDHGNGTGSFTALYLSPVGEALVSGSITLRHVGNGSTDPYHFQLEYGGVGFSFLGGREEVLGGGDFTCYTVSSYSLDYGPYALTGHPAYWAYSGKSTEWAQTFWGGAYEATHIDSVAQTWWHVQPALPARMAPAVPYYPPHYYP